MCLERGGVRNVKFNFVDLFSGIGGFRIAFERVGGNCIAFSEICPDAINTYKSNFQIEDEVELGDITKINDILGKVDILLAGVPCQSWSIAGRNLGFSDDRGQLWNDTIYLLKKKQPSCFVFENVKGLSDPRNSEALHYIMARIKQAGYFAKYFILNSYDFGLVQNRIRIYIVGFKEKKYLEKISILQGCPNTTNLSHVFDNLPTFEGEKVKLSIQELHNGSIPGARTKFQKIDELNDFFLLTDIRDGHSAIHSWDLKETTKREKDICYLLLRNRRKAKYGSFDGNPLSLSHFQELDPSIKREELETLVGKGIFKKVICSYGIVNQSKICDQDRIILGYSSNGVLKLDDLKLARKEIKFNFSRWLGSMSAKEIIKELETRYEFNYTKISSGINGICRVYLPNSDVFSTLVASDTNDFVATENVYAKSAEEFREKFINDIYKNRKFRKITKNEAIKIQGFPREFKLPGQRSKWMKLIGNSVSVPVVEAIAHGIVNTGVFSGGLSSVVKKQA